MLGEVLRPAGRAAPGARRVAPATGRARRVDSALAGGGGGSSAAPRARRLLPGAASRAETGPPPTGPMHGVRLRPSRDAGAMPRVLDCCRAGMIRAREQHRRVRCQLRGGSAGWGGPRPRRPPWFRSPSSGAAGHAHSGAATRRRRRQRLPDQAPPVRSSTFQRSNCCWRK